jgi:pyrroline-5-carboxylate reductase
MALSRPDQDRAAMLDALATPGGITEHGLALLRRRQALVAWTEALDAVLKRNQVPTDVPPGDAPPHEKPRC